MFSVKGKYAESVVYTDNIEAQALAQIQELCNQPMFENAKIRIMPDCHAGAGCVIGFTAVLDKAMIVPNLVGVDIGCGVMTTIFKGNKNFNFKALDDFIRANIPSGCSVRNTKHSSVSGKIESTVVKICKDIGESNEKIQYHLNSLGTLGGGNHYIEIGKANQDDTYVLTVHTGSRNLGKKICEFYQNKAVQISEDLKNSILTKHKTAKTAEEHTQIQNELSSLYKVPKQLAFIEHDDYNAYIRNMLMAKDVAHINRTIITNEIMYYLISAGVCERVVSMHDTIHNYVSREDGKIVIRKGAISAKKNEALTIPLNMRDGVIIGTGKGNPDWNNSAPHGAGRLMSRSEAKETISLEEFKESMQDINTWSVNSSTIDESPMVYKPAQEIIDLVQDTVNIDFIAKPVYNFKASE